MQPRAAKFTSGGQGLECISIFVAGEVKESRVETELEHPLFNKIMPIKS